MPVLDDLTTWGPDRTRPAPELAAAERYCRKLARKHYENFPVVTWLLPRRLRQHFYHIYAFCRWADDLGDETGDRDRSLALLAWWREELGRCYAGDADHPVFVALMPTIRRFGIPAGPFVELISAFEQDQNVLSYDTYEQLLDYCRRSANPVGHLVLFLCERFDDENARLSDSVCTGLQLANFWQDVARDFNIGRVYLPREDRNRFGYTEQDLEQCVTNDSFLELMAFEVDRARRWLLEGRPLVKAMPGRLRMDIDLFIRGGLLILDEIEQIEYRVWEHRPMVRKHQFLRAGLASLLGRPIRDSRHTRRGRLAHAATKKEPNQTESAD